MGSARGKQLCYPQTTERIMIMEKICKNCGTPTTKEYCEDNYPEVCEHWSPKKPKTNADRIREMSDEELAEFLTHINPTNCQDCAFSVGWRCQPDRDDYSDFDKCKEGRKRWLKQPAKEEE